MDTGVESFATHTNSLNDCFDMKEEVKDIDYDKAIESWPDIRHEDFEIKSEENCSGTRLQNLKDEPVDCTRTSLLTNCMTVKEEIKDICDDSAIESLSSIKCEDIEIKSDEDYGDTRVPNLEDQACSKDRGLKHRVFFENKTYKCNSCEYETNQKKYLTRHQLKHIPEEQMYKCNFCAYKTGQKNTFTAHQLVHKNIPEDQMFKCNLCDYKALRKGNLASHQLRHQKVPEGQMYKCDFCDHKTIFKRNLEKHQLIHKAVFEDQKYRCDLCGFKTIYKNSITQHQLKHKDISKMIQMRYKCLNKL